MVIVNDGMVLLIAVVVMFHVVRIPYRYLYINADLIAN